MKLLAKNKKNYPFPKKGREINVPQWRTWQKKKRTITPLKREKKKMGGGEVAGREENTHHQKKWWLTFAPHTMHGQHKALGPGQ